MAFRPSLPPFILESAALRSQSAWTLMAQALLTGLVSGGVIGLFRWLYTIINGAVRAHMAGQDPFAPATLALMRAIKATLDPNGILNPDKILPE